MDGKIRGLIQSIEKREMLAQALADTHKSRNKEKFDFHTGRVDAFRTMKKFIEENFK
jgi:hypothetical protein